MKLTEIQEAWLVSLETSPPEKQANGFLGKEYKDGSYAACCLGELHIIGCKINGFPSPFVDGYLRSNGDSKTLVDSYDGYHLIYSAGQLREQIEVNGRQYSCLSEMNDKGMTWKQIAAYVRENPQNVFTNIN